MNSRIASLATAALAAGCASIGALDAPAPSSAPRPQAGPARRTWQGWLGVSHVEAHDVDSDPGFGQIADVDDGDMPVFGGVLMKPFTYERLQFGLEGGMWFGWEGDVDAVALGSGGVLQEADTDLFLTELFGGPFVALNLSPRARVYLSGGLTLDFTSIYYQWDDPTGGHIHGYDTGFGDGYYGRTGLEFQVAPGTWFGVGVRRVESSLDPGGQIDHIDLRQTQYLFTFAYSM